MKKLITILAVFGFATTAMAEDMKQSGSFRTQYMNETNFDGDFNDDTAGNRSQMFQQRLIWSPSFKVSDAVSVHSTFVHASVWGSNPTDQIPGAGTGAAITEDNGLVVNEAYMNWMINDESMLRMGRGAFTMGDGRVVAQNSWEQVSKAFDGLMYTHDHEMARVSAFGVRGANAGTANEYGNFFGVSADFKSLPDFLKSANLHYVIIKKDDSPGFGAQDNSEDTTRLGVTLGGDTAGFDYNVTYAMYSGEEGDGATTTLRDVDASMYDVTVGYSMPDVKNLRISAQMHSDTGDDAGTSDNEAYSGFHYDTHNNAGLMDLATYGNLTFMRIGATANLKEDCSLGLDYYTFTLTEDNGGEDELGTEIDVWFGHQYSSNFSAKVRYGTFDPGKAITASGDAQSDIYLEGTMTF